MQATTMAALVGITAADIRRSCRRGACEPVPTQYHATAAPAAQLSATGSVRAGTRMTDAIAAGTDTISASGASSAVFSSAPATVHGADTITTRMSPGAAPRLLRRRVREDLSLIHISEPTRLGMISYAVFCL